MDFAWLSQILEVVTGIIPQVITIPTTEHGLWFRRGRGPYLLPTGVHEFVPMFDQIFTVPATEETAEAAEQTVTVADGKSLTVDSSLRYLIVDPVACVTAYGEEYDQNIVFHMRAVIAEQLAVIAVGDIAGVTRDKLAVALRLRLATVGISVVEFCISESAVTRALKHYGVNLNVSTDR